MITRSINDMLKRLKITSFDLRTRITEQARSAMMAVNPYALNVNKRCYNVIDKVNNYASSVGDLTRLTKKKMSAADRSNYIYKDRSRFIYAKRQPGALRR